MPRVARKKAENAEETVSEVAMTQEGIQEPTSAENAENAVESTVKAELTEEKPKRVVRTRRKTVAKEIAETDSGDFEAAGAESVGVGGDSSEPYSDGAASGRKAARRRTRRVMTAFSERPKAAAREAKEAPSR